jgi:hypothetical protein
MEYGKVFKRSWQTVWRYRTLWLFGALLALTTSGGLLIYGNHLDRSDLNGVAVKISKESTIYLPGEGVSIDLTAPGRPLILVDGKELERLIEWPTGAEARGVWAVLIAVGAVLATMIVLGIIARYVAEAALIRMVSEAEGTGEKVGVRRGLRLGFSRTAWRLFLIDLAIKLPVALAFLVLSALVLSPLLLWTSGSTAAGVIGTLFTTGLFFLMIVVALAVSLVLSPLVQVARRACGVEGLGVGASIRRGFATLRHHLQPVAVVWLSWLGVRLAWTLAALPILILISPVLLVSLMGGIVAGGLPAVAVGGLLSLFLESPFSWIVGVVVGLPIFVLVTLAPMFFLEGLVEVFKSSTWTLTYRELRVQEAGAPERARKRDAATAKAVAAA